MVDAASLEPPLTKVLDLPQQKVLVERAARYDARRRQLGQRRLCARKVRDRANVEALFPVGVRRQESGKSVVAQVFEEQPALRRVLAVDGRHIDGARREKVAHLEERPAGVLPGLGDLLGLGALRNEHRHGRAAWVTHAKVAASRRAARHRFELDAPGGRGRRESPLDQAPDGAEVQRVNGGGGRSDGHGRSGLAARRSERYHSDSMVAKLRVAALGRPDSELGPAQGLVRALVR
jgi:hypothetical protein